MPSRKYAGDDVLGVPQKVEKYLGGLLKWQKKFVLEKKPEDL